ncbi:NB-ARC domain-containing protein [Crossiella sp. SN42]|uniref:NB-ARC domain-containing protein n=1 Tax=Crossiella sp. SN42 TaxID=2944808 RepID=UPI00207D6AA5|nr:NB-ARC domain-containing protein [Crossiella sp. SN42]MCO1580479.1 NB-ARC domain-containing protein [Crossiella sp. SN42]
MSESWPVPAEVPSAQEPFVGREPELVDLTTLSGQVRIVLIWGIGGIGKSALSQWWSAQMSDRFTGGQLYVDLAEFRSQEGTAVGDAIAEILRRNGVAIDHIPASLSGRTALYRTWLANRSVLVVLDGVADAAEVTPLVPTSPDSLVLVTSEKLLHELTRAGARPLLIEPLDEDDSVQLLREQCGADRIDAEPEDARRLARLCAGLPVALRVVGAQLLGRPRLKLAALADKLADESSRLSRLSVAAVFNSAYDDLSESARVLHRRLGLLPLREITIELAVVAADVDPEEAADLLEELVTANLLNEVGDDRFRQHDLILLHARDRGETQEFPDARKALFRRLWGYYLAHSAFADRAIMGADRLRIVDLDQAMADYRDPFAGDDAKGQAIEWMAAHRANLLGVLRAVAELGWDDEAWQLAELLVPLYFNRRHLADWIESADLGAPAARRAGRPDAEARLRSVVSRAHTGLGDLNRAREELAIARELAEGLDGANRKNRILLASVWEFTGRYLDLVDRAGAEEAYQRSIQLNAEAGEHRGVGLGKLYLGGTLHALGRTDEALDSLGEALNALRDDQRLAGRALLALAEIHAEQGLDDQARVELEQALSVFIDRKAAHLRAQADRALADIAVRQGDAATAREHLQAALRYHEETGGPDVAELGQLLDRLED